METLALEDKIESLEIELQDLKAENQELTLELEKYKDAISSIQWEINNIK